MLRSEEQVIYLDESGFTGQDLVSEIQPVLALATIQCSEAEALKWKTKYFGKINAKELKHSRISRSHNQQRMVLEFLTELLVESERVYVTIAHKRYSLLAKSVDWIIEPAMMETGYDLYADGGAKPMANMLWYCLPAFTSPEFFTELLTRIQEWARHPNEINYNNLFATLGRPHVNQNAEELLNYYRIAGTVLGQKLNERLAETPLDIVYSITLFHVAESVARKNEKYKLVHDQSATMSNNRALWDQMTSGNMPQSNFAASSGTPLFPINLESTSFEDSKFFAGLQLADVVSGSFAHFARWLVQGRQESDTYGRELSEVYEDINFGRAVWPEENFESKPDGPDKASMGLEYFAEFFRRNRN